MPSPIAHVAMGYFFYKTVQPARQNLQPGAATPSPRLLPVAIAFSILPDFDCIPAVFVGNMSLFHNQWTHSLLVGLTLALIVGGIAGLAKKRKSSFISWFSVAFVCYGLHSLMDTATLGRGIQLFWPFTSERYKLPFLLFYGLRWSDGWLSARHIWTAANELVFVAVLGLIYYAAKSLAPQKLPRVTQYWRQIRSQVYQKGEE